MQVSSVEIEHKQGTSHKQVQVALASLVSSTMPNVLVVLPRLAKSNFQVFERYTSQNKNT